MKSTPSWLLGSEHLETEVEGLRVELGYCTDQWRQEVERLRAESSAKAKS